MLFEKLDYQEKCVANIAAILNDGIQFSTADFSLLKQSIDKSYKENGYKQFPITNYSRLDVLMETGTGKTFTYIKTIFEINKQFGQNRFIIVVPRNAIKAGVIQNISLTKEYFFNEYGKHLNIIEYPKDGVSKVEFDFLGDDSRVSVLVLTSGSFANKDAILNRPPEQGLLHRYGTVWGGVAHKRPIVIIDEPHLLKGTATVRSLEKLDKSLFIRFGATYPTDKGHELSNVAYVLDSISAFNEYLVKRIRVNTLLSDNGDGSYQLSNIQSGGKQDNKSFTLVYFLNQENFSQTLRVGEDIGVKTGIPTLKGIHATKINAQEVFLSNASTLTLEKMALSADEIRFMLRATIEKHFEKEERLFSQRLKTLSLFFIPGVQDFRGPNPLIKNLFEEEFKTKRAEVLKATLNEEYKAYLKKDLDKDGKLVVHEGYFSGDGKGKGSTEDKEGADIDLILNKKEELLKFDTPLRFIFSVWALQEGWDNPNIFNICKISQTTTETSRRQQVGRGLRLAVNQDGKRMTYKHLEDSEYQFYDINTLDMVVSKNELDFIEGIQSEIQQASYTLVGDIISHEILKEKGLTSKEISKLLDSLEEAKIVTYNEPSDNYTIESSIHDYLAAHGSELTYLTAERLAEIKAIFKENVLAVENGNSKKSNRMVKINSLLMKEFKDLWETINRKSKVVYSGLQEDVLLNAIATAFASEKIEAVPLKIITREYNTQTNTLSAPVETPIKDRVKYFSQHNYQALVDTLLKDAKLKIPLSFILKLLNKVNLEKFHNNPKEATLRLKKIIAERIHQSVIQLVDYQFTGETRITTLQDATTGKYLTQFPHTLLGRKFVEEAAPAHLLFDTVVYDSEIERTIQLTDPTSIGKDKITVFAKLPPINIPTPYKTYSPDFAYLVAQASGKKLFLVVEAKGYNTESEIPVEEQNKIAYAEKFFRKLQDEMPDVDIAFKKRVNKTELSTILNEIAQGA